MGGGGGSEVPQHLWLKMTPPPNALIILRYVSRGHSVTSFSGRFALQVVSNHSYLDEPLWTAL